ncbi:hypothetical protein COOONC_03002 [Cooperia oncophora]
MTNSTAAGLTNRETSLAISSIHQFALSQGIAQFASRIVELWKDRTPEVRTGHLLRDHTFWLAAAYAEAISSAVDNSPTATAESSQDLFRLPTQQSVQSSTSSLSSCNVSAKKFSSGRSFSTAYDSDVSSLSLSSDCVDMKVFTGTRGILADDSSLDCQNILQAENVVKKSTTGDSLMMRSQKNMNLRTWTILNQMETWQKTMDGTNVVEI